MINETGTPVSTPIAADAAIRLDAAPAKPKDKTAAERQRRHRQRKRVSRELALRAVTEAAVTPPEKPHEIEIEPRVTVMPPVRSRFSLASTVLAVTALGLAAVGLCINGWFAHSLGSTEVAGWLFLAIGVAADVAAFMLPSVAASQWRNRHYGAALAGWATWALTFCFAVVAGIGFASVNIADTTLARAGRDTPAIVTARTALADAKAARDRECTKVGPICRQREDAVVDRQRQLDTAMRSVESTADPQTDAATKLVAWASLGWLRPKGDDFGMLRLLLLALLPQIGGVLLMVSRSQ